MSVQVREKCCNKHLRRGCHCRVCPITNQLHQAAQNNERQVVHSALLSNLPMMAMAQDTVSGLQLVGV